jgi:hypothetical protein
LDEPPRRNEKIDRIAKERGPIALNRMTYELQDPASHKQGKRPTPSEEKQRPRNRYHRHPNHVTELVDWVLMLRTIIVDEMIHVAPRCY